MQLDLFHNPTTTVTLGALIFGAIAFAQNPLCTSDDIANVNVLGCDCPSDFPPQDDKTCKTNPQICTLKYQTCVNPTTTPLVALAKMTRCGVGCTDENADCNACYIWFNGLCNCLKRLTGQLKTGCEVYPKSTLTIGQRTPPAWILNNQHDIITTTYKIPGILELHDVPDYNGGFDFGQNKLQGDKHGALALNPAASRSEEQLHIHLCTNDNDPIRDALTGLTRSGFTSLAPVDITSVKSSYGTMWCRVAPNKGDININQGQDILDYLQKIDTLYGPSNCERYHVGAGYMKDKNDYAWSCVTTASSAEGIFCHS